MLSFWHILKHGVEWSDILEWQFRVGVWSELSWTWLKVKTCIRSGPPKCRLMLINKHSKNSWPFRVDPFSETGYCAGKQTGSHKSRSPSKDWRKTTKCIQIPPPKSWPWLLTRFRKCRSTCSEACNSTNGFVVNYCRYLDRVSWNSKCHKIYA